MNLIKKTLTSLLLVLLIGTGVMWANTYRELRKLRASPVTIVDTVRLEYVPDEVRSEIARLRDDNVSLRERLTGVNVIRPEEGKGPVIVYDEPVPIDTALAAVSIDKGELRITVQAPDSTHAKLLALPVKDIRDCTSLLLGGNGMVRCDKPALGILDVFAEASVSAYPTVQAFDRVGVTWQRSATSQFQLQVWSRPQTWLTTEPTSVYIGGRIQLNLLGR